MENGTAYGRPSPSYRSELTLVGHSTPMGELLRRHWHPVGLATDATATPRKVRQPWYPIEERYGLVFAYMGPTQKKPLLPRYECLEELAPGEFVEADDSSIGSGGAQIVPCNWLQHWENVVDPFHVPILHGSFSGPQFIEQMGLVPKVSFESTPRSIIDRLQTDLKAVINLPEVKERMVTQGQTPLGNTPEEFVANVRTDLPKWDALIKASGAMLE